VQRWMEVRNTNIAYLANDVGANKLFLSKLDTELNIIEQ